MALNFSGGGKTNASSSSSSNGLQLLGPLYVLGTLQ